MKMHGVVRFIARCPVTKCGIIVPNAYATALGRVTCGNCRRTR